MIDLGYENPYVPISRADVDRARRVSIALGGNSPLSSLSLADEVLRLHGLLACIARCLQDGYPEAALAMARVESDPSWGHPVDEDVPPGA